jgi:hypothetical protein
MAIYNILTEQAKSGEINTELLLGYSARTRTALFDVFTICLRSIRENPGNSLELRPRPFPPSSLVNILLPYIRSNNSYG